MLLQTVVVVLTGTIIQNRDETMMIFNHVETAAMTAVKDHTAVATVVTVITTAVESEEIIMVRTYKNSHVINFQKIYSMSHFCSRSKFLLKLTWIKTFESKKM